MLGILVRRIGHELVFIDTTEEDTIVKPEGPLETLLIDNFSDGDNIHEMGESIANSLNSSGEWYLIPADGKMGNGVISIEPKVTTYTNPFLDIIETVENENKQVHFKVTFPDSAYRAYGNKTTGRSTCALRAATCLGSVKFPK